MLILCFAPAGEVLIEFVGELPPLMRAEEGADLDAVAMRAEQQGRILETALVQYHLQPVRLEDAGGDPPLGVDLLQQQPVGEQADTLRPAIARQVRAQQPPEQQPLRADEAEDRPRADKEE